MISEHTLENSYYQESLSEQLDSYSKNIELSECYSDLTIDSIDLSLQFEEWEKPEEENPFSLDFNGEI